MLLGCDALCPCAVLVDPQTCQGKQGLPAVALMRVLFLVCANSPLTYHWHMEEDVATFPPGLFRLQRSASDNNCQKRRAASLSGAYARYTRCEQRHVRSIQSVQGWVRHALTRPVKSLGRLTDLCAHRRRPPGGKVCLRSDGALSRTFIMKLARWLRTHGSYYTGKH